MIKTPTYIGISAVVIVLFSACCGFQQEHKFHFIHGSVFGTTYSIKFQGDSSLVDSINSIFQEIDASFSLFNPESNLRRINEGKTTEMSNMTSDVVKLALNVSHATGGAFDITIAPLTNAWGFGFKSDRLPTDEDVDSLLTLVGHQNIQVDKRTLTKNNPAIMIDCGAIAKGYACDEIGAMLKYNGVENFIVEIGGEIVTNGHNEKNKKWRVGIDSPNFDPDFQTPDAIVEIGCGAVATSGNYRNFRVSSSQRYSHEIDPRTGKPATTDMLSVTVFAESCAVADAYATAFMVLGFGETLKVLESHPELQVYLLYEENGIMMEWHSSGLILVQNEDFKWYKINSECPISLN